MFSRRLNFPGKIIDKCIENLKSYRERFTRIQPSKFVSRILYLVALVYNLYFFFQADVLRRLFDIGFSYKHCNFTPACLPVKMASKTVIRPIVSLVRTSLVNEPGKCVKTIAVVYELPKRTQEKLFAD